MFRHLFVTTDGGRCANAALPLAADLARTCGARVTVAYVLPDLLGVYEGPYTRDYAREYGQPWSRAGTSCGRRRRSDRGPGRCSSTGGPATWGTVSWRGSGKRART